MVSEVQCPPCLPEQERTPSREVCAWGSQMVFSKTTLSGDRSRSELRDRHQIPSELPNPQTSGSSAQLSLQHSRLICVHTGVHPSEGETLMPALL